MGAEHTPFNIFNPNPNPNGNRCPRRVILVRHGETDWNLSLIPQGQVDVPLNANGRRQAQALAARLCQWDIDAIYSSDLVRASETADAVGRALDLVPNLIPGWREFDLGRWVGLTFAEIEKQFPDELAALARGEDVARGGGETRRDVQRRVVAAFEQIVAHHPDESVLVVSHGGTLKVLFAYLIGLAPENLDRLSTGGNTGVSVVQYRQGLARLTLLNDTSHLDQECG